jgi:hypothetical protein
VGKKIRVEITMQQHISPEWLDELTAKEQDILRQMWEPMVGDIYLRVSVKGEVDNIPFVFDSREKSFSNCKQYKIPLLSIGQMIELLIEHKDIAEGVISDRADIFWEESESKELWEEVKEVIKAKARGE